MPSGQLYIYNGGAWKDAYTTWGVSLDGTGLSALMAPAELKDYVKNESALEDGSRVVTVTPKLRERELALGINLSASSQAQFLTRYAAFLSVLQSGPLKIKTSFQTGVVYNCLYVSCTSFAEYRLGLAKFILKLLEPNPANRAS